MTTVKYPEDAMQRHKTPFSDLKAAGVLLLGLGLLKLPLIWQISPFAERDAVFHLPIPVIGAVMAFVEISIAISILLFLSTAVSAKLLCGIGAAFLSYRSAYSMFGEVGEPCPCLGAARAFIPFLTFYENRILMAIAAWFFLVGLWHYLRGKYGSMD